MTNTRYGHHHHYHHVAYLEHAIIIIIAIIMITINIVMIIVIIVNININVNVDIGTNIIIRWLRQTSTIIINIIPLTIVAIGTLFFFQHLLHRNSINIYHKFHHIHNLLSLSFMHQNQ